MAISMHVFDAPFYTFTVPMLDVARVYDARTQGEDPRYLYKDFDIQGKFFIVTTFEPGDFFLGNVNGKHVEFSTAYRPQYFADQIAGKQGSPFSIRTNSGNHSYNFPKEAVSIGDNKTFYVKPGMKKTGFFSAFSSYGQLEQYAGQSAVRFGEPVFMLFSGKCSSPGNTTRLCDVLVEFAKSYTNSAFEQYQRAENAAKKDAMDQGQMLAKLREILALQDEFKAKEMLRSMDFIKFEDALTQLKVDELAKLLNLK